LSQTTILQIMSVSSLKAADLFENYGNCPRIENAPDPIKPAKLEDGVYVLTGIAHGVLKKKDTGEEFDSVIGYLEDGTRVSTQLLRKERFHC
jgi:hypothetical protein